MSIFSDILSAITTRGRRITIKMGLAKDFNDSKLKVGELGLVIDTDEVRIGLANGTTKVLGGGLDVSELPNASATTLGVVKVGTNINVTSGTVSVANASTSAKGVVQLNDTLTSTSTTLALTAKQGNEIKKLIDNLTASSGGGITIADIPIASTTQDGLMPKAMVTKLSGIASGANFVQVVDNLTSTSTTQALSANQGKILKDLIGGGSTSSGDVKSDGSVAMGYLTIGSRKSGSVVGANSFSQGSDNEASGGYSLALGELTTASGQYSYAQGYNTKATNMASHAEGSSCVSSGLSAHAEGYSSKATGSYSHAEGWSTTASGSSSHAEGESTTASGSNSHAEGYKTTASDFCSHAQGYANKKMTGSASTFSTSNTAFIIGNGSSSLSNAFRVMFDGSTYGQGAFNSTGADYAEYFEWQDLNPNDEDRAGYFVTLNGEKIEIANSNSDYIIGVISANPSVIGDSYQDQWQGMYVTDEWGRIQNEYINVEYEEIDEEGNTITKTRQDYVHKLNPEYDTNSDYTPREQRKEWDAVGMLGKLLVRDDGTCEVNGYTKVSDGGIATKSDSGYRVIKRVDENIVQIIFK